MDSIDLHGSNLSASGQVRGSSLPSETVSEVHQLFIFRENDRDRISFKYEPASSDSLSQLWLIFGVSSGSGSERSLTIDSSLDHLLHYQDVRTRMESCVCVVEKEEDMFCMSSRCTRMWLLMMAARWSVYESVWPSLIGQIAHHYLY